MLRNLAALLSLSALLLCQCTSRRHAADTPPARAGFLRGADLSFLPEMEAAGTVFYDRAGRPKDALLIFRENGCNAVRIRAWHTPATSHSGSAEVAALARRVRSLGMKVWLDIHYADHWADPGKQPKPAAWQPLEGETLQEAVYDYTRALLAQVQPDLVQIGNEINNGMLWPSGRYPEQAEQFAALLRAGISAARAHDPRMTVMLHYAGVEGAEPFFRFVRGQQLDYDLMGLSYYPKWHGKSLDTLAAVMGRLAQAHHKPINVCEIAYPFTLEWADHTTNLVGQDDLVLPEYPPTPEGQRRYLLRLRQIVEHNPQGMGFCYWAPDWVAFRGKTATDGSGWENQAQFDFERRALPSMDLYRE
ncbi:MAG TPA: glycosyl hydrolase 53 family protein [Saprospiraceae bacterium]|nr:glycosyl hydrolase 53 family protein [Saprospiraceae bacterium]